MLMCPNMLQATQALSDKFLMPVKSFKTPDNYLLTCYAQGDEEEIYSLEISSDKVIPNGVKVVNTYLIGGDENPDTCCGASMYFDKIINYDINNPDELIKHRKILYNGNSTLTSENFNYKDFFGFDGLKSSELHLIDNFNMQATMKVFYTSSKGSYLDYPTLYSNEKLFNGTDTLYTSFVTTAYNDTRKLQILDEVYEVTPTDTIRFFSFPNSIELPFSNIKSITGNINLPTGTLITNHTKSSINIEQLYKLSSSNIVSGLGASGVAKTSNAFFRAISGGVLGNLNTLDSGISSYIIYFRDKMYEYVTGFNMEYYPVSYNAPSSCQINFIKSCDINPYSINSITITEMDKYVSCENIQIKIEKDIVQGSDGLYYIKFKISTKTGINGYFGCIYGLTFNFNFNT